VHILQEDQAMPHLFGFPKSGTMAAVRETVQSVHNFAIEFAEIAKQGLIDARPVALRRPTR
jgi:hypothetical protein